MMSRTRNYDHTTLQVMKRFFFAVDVSLEKGLLKSINYFCTSHSIDKRHFYDQRKELTRGYFQISWLTYLVRDTNISPLWLLMGVGDMYEKCRASISETLHQRIMNAIKL